MPVSRILDSSRRGLYLYILFAKECNEYKSLAQVLDQVEETQEDILDIHENFEEKISDIQESVQLEIEKAQKEMETAQEEVLEDIQDELVEAQEKFEEKVEDAIEETKSTFSIFRILAIIATSLVGVAMIAIGVMFVKGWFILDKIRKANQQIRKAIRYGRRAKKEVDKWVKKFQGKPDEANPANDEESPVSDDDNSGAEQESSL